MVNMKVFIVERRSYSDGDPDFIVTMERKTAFAASHAFFESHGFELHGSRAFDPKASDEDDDDCTNGYDVFDNVEVKDGKIVSFTHLVGDGPCCEIYEVEMS